MYGGEVRPTRLLSFQLEDFNASNVEPILTLPVVSVVVSMSDGQSTTTTGSSFLGMIYRVIILQVPVLAREQRRKHIYLKWTRCP